MTDLFVCLRRAAKPTTGNMASRFLKSTYLKLTASSSFIPATTLAKPSLPASTPAASSSTSNPRVVSNPATRPPPTVKPAFASASTSSRFSTRTVTNARASVSTRLVSGPSTSIVRRGPTDDGKPAPSLRKKFDLAASLAQPLSYKPKLGTSRRAPRCVAVRRLSFADGFWEVCAQARRIVTRVRRARRRRAR